MPKITLQSENVVAETLLIALYARALEAQRSTSLVRDDKAVALVEQMDYDFSRFRLKAHDQTTTIMRLREFDRRAQDFLARHPQAAVIHIGCGLDTRFERVDNGQVEWYDLDLPEVIALRRKLIGDEGIRYHLLGCSAFDSAWLDTVSAHRQRPFLFLAEGVFMYLEGAQVKSLVLTLRDRFPGAELVFDAYSPLHVWTNTLLFSIKKLGAPLHWGIWRGQKIEGWGDGIRLLDEWGWLDQPEPRLAHIRWLRGIPLIGRMFRIYHYRLGKAAG